MNVFELGLGAGIEKDALDLLNAAGDALGLNASSSPRTVGDVTQDYLCQNLGNILPQDRIDEYAGEFARRAMADLAFKDRDGNYYVVDIKTHSLSTKFNMPNLVSVERLSRFYEDPTNLFCILYVGYELQDEKWVFSDCRFVPIENLDWSCLTIGALGWGQIQIANANIIKTSKQSRRSWMIELCDVLLEFYPREMGKIQDRLSHFESVRERWLARAEE